MADETNVQASAEPTPGDIKVDLSKQPATLESQAYGPDGKLTRDGMTLLIRAGRAVMVGNRVVYRESDLPTEAQLAQGDAVKTERAKAAIQAQMDALKAQLATLGAEPTDQHPAYKDVPSMSPGNVLIGGLGTGDTAGVETNEQAAAHIVAQAQVAKANSTVPEVPAGQNVASDTSADQSASSKDSGKSSSSSSSSASAKDTSK